MERERIQKIGYVLGIFLITLGVILTFVISPLLLMCLCIPPPVQGMIAGILGVSFIVIGIILFMSCHQKKIVLKKV
jgi:multisubunit Na+/H+ antiporter MnhG subunit